MLPIPYADLLKPVGDVPCDNHDGAALQEHAQIVARLRARDPEGARQQMYAHLHASLLRYQPSLKKEQADTSMESCRVVSTPKSLKPAPHQSSGTEIACFA